MVTLFTTPKPFKGRIADIQVNSLRSWKLLHPDAEVIIFGNEEGTADIARTLGLIHVPDVKQSGSGLPFVDAMFSLAGQFGSHDIQCCLNSDIILFNDFIRALEQIPFERFLLVGQRWDLDLEGLIDFTVPDWQERLLKRKQRHGVLHPPAGSDYFVFKKGTLGKLLPTIIGRPGWDNGMIHHARSHKIPVIDCSEVITLIHQNHPAAYVDLSSAETIDLETQRNIRLVPTPHQLTLIDADWIWTESGVVHKRGWDYFLQSIKCFPVLHPRLAWSSVITEALIHGLNILNTAYSDFKTGRKAKGQQVH